jgi:hypothetical protein
VAGVAGLFKGEVELGREWVGVNHCFRV